MCLHSCGCSLKFVSILSVAMMMVDRRGWTPVADPVQLWLNLSMIYGLPWTSISKEVHTTQARKTPQVSSVINLETLDTAFYFIRGRDRH